MSRKLLICAVVIVASGGCVDGHDLQSESVNTVTGPGYNVDPTAGTPDADTLFDTVPGAVFWLGGWNVNLPLPEGIWVPTVTATIDRHGQTVGFALASDAASVIVQKIVNSGVGSQQITLSPAHMVAANEHLVLRFTTPGATNTPVLQGIRVNGGPFGEP